MNKYTCVKCGTVCVIASNLPELKEASCTCGMDKVMLKLGVHEIKKPAPKNVVPPIATPPPPQAPKPQPPVVFNSNTASQLPKSK